VGASLCGGAAYAWLNRTVRSWLQEFGVDVNERAVYERLNALAQANEDVGGLRVRTTFLGMRGDGETAGSIEGITLENMELGGLARATLNGMVDELHRLYQEATGSRVPGTGTSPRYVLATGGAVHKNALLSRLIEDRVGLPMHRPAHSEVAAIGTAWLAADPGRE
jgi:glycerol kinase